ncbi:type IX secretion system membrane protein PorP/SprF [Flavobacterium pectinovorum]|uniref:PorP/SprF family type IX secretion system membrane protein n=1 Tax=Flavobacterium pectinovorum TaxID=29533 RepID=UPI001FAE3A2D|nr:type IX secretion system membrane protein PorP/SprF [Flavobacterium pectinovorum]MCI9846073.1 type IX secretion system membrane protein PorP/SprF [Flavobacterium pectinovorum]
MKKILLFLTLFYGTSQLLYSQDTNENGVVSFSLPIRNSLKFNRYLINPTFSFVREQNPTVSFYNKRQYLQFDDAPNTYLFNYSGRLKENDGYAIGLFQQNYGLMTVFGGVFNFAHNIELQEDSNLTFGLNVGAYQSGLDKGKIISESPGVLNGDYPSNTLIAINPGINYGTAFLDFGLSMNNLILYNFGSGMVKEDPEKAIQLHAMYTGYIDSYGFFDQSKFSGIVKTEIKKDNTIISGLAMLTIPQGIWAQAGYNTLNGISAGLGVNITPNIAIEYNYERGLGNFTNLGSSHEFVIAYKFKNTNYYYGDDEEGSLIDTSKPKPVIAKKSTTPITRVDGATKAKLAAEAKAKADAEALQVRLAAAEKVKADAEAAAKAKLAADTKAKADAEALKIKLAADAKVNADAEATKTKLLADAKAKADAEEAKRKAEAKAKMEAADLQSIIAADAKAKADSDALQARLAAEAKAKAAAEAKTKAAKDAAAKAKAAADAKARTAELAAEKERLAAEAKVKADAEARQARIAAEAKAKADAEALQIKLVADAKAKADAEALKIKLAADAKAKADAEALQAKLAADAKAKADMEALQAKLLADAKVKADAEATNKAKAEAEAKQLKLAEEAKAKADAEALQAKLAAEAKAKADAEALKIKLAADAKAKADAEALQAKLAADAKAKADAEALQAKLAADAKAKADAEALQAKLAADAKAKADAEALQAKLAADAKAKADAEALQAKLAADAKAKADAEALQAKLAADAKAKADAEALQAKLAADAKAKADAEALAAAALKDESAKELDNLTQLVENSGKTQSDLIAQFNTTVANKQKDLNDMKEENDLSEKGIYKEPKPFKSVSAENAQIESLKSQIADANRTQKNAITNLTNLYNERLKKVPNKNDALNRAYLEKINELKAAQLKAEQDNIALITNLERIKTETEIEKKRRIKRAAYENDEGRYAQDVAALKRIKETTKLSSTPLTESDFDFGEDQSNMQIIKNIKNSESGYYLIIAVHNSVEKRDEFLRKAVAAGRSDVNFFYNVTTSKYYIYYEKHEDLSGATKALEAKGSKPYNNRMVIVKVEN